MLVTSTPQGIGPLTVSPDNAVELVTLGGFGYLLKCWS
jgi:hypothetical protein